MKLTWFGHSTFRLDLPGAVLIVDPWFEGNPACHTPMASAIEGATHVLVTHGHDDHAADAAAVCRASGATLIANYEICTWLGSRGVEVSEPMNTGGTVNLGAFEVTLTVAHHSSSHGREDGTSLYLGNPHGAVISAPGERTIYFAGDTDVFGDMALIAELHEPKIGVLPIGDRFTMGARGAALAAKRFFAFEVVVPCHYATFPGLAPDTSAFEAAMQGAQARIAVPRQGEAIEL